jgi:ribosomal protein S18 acetylase RimI-like enzyme
MTISYRPFCLKTDEDLLLSLVNCYREVFADPPWNEHMVCSSCGRIYGRLLGCYTAVTCDDCRVALDEFWPVATVIRDLRHELTKEASCWLATDSERVIGFSWCYPMAAIDLEVKLLLDGVAQAIHEMGDHASLSYLDEIGVLAPYRGRGIAHRLYDIHVDELRRSKISLMVARTKKQPPTVVYHWFTRIGYSEIATYGEGDGRVILASSLNGQT